MGTRRTRWRKNPITWIMKDGGMQPTSSSGSAQTKRVFRDFQLHIEWKTPAGFTCNSYRSGQREQWCNYPGNYEVQILDSYDNRTIPYGQAGAVYMQICSISKSEQKRRSMADLRNHLYSSAFLRTVELFYPPKITIFITEYWFRTM